MGVTLGAPYAGQIGNFSTPPRQQAVILESLAWGHEGGNDLFATFRNPGAANAPLTVNMTGNELVVDLATDATRRARRARRRRSSTRSTPTPAAAAKLKAYRYRGFAVAGTGIAQATPRSPPVGLAERARARPARAVPGEDAAHRQAARRHRRSASSSTASSTRASG